MPDTGVSAACPVAAGCVAALRTRVSPGHVPPAQLFDVLKATARTGNGGYGPGGQWNSTSATGSSIRSRRAATERHSVARCRCG